MAGAGWKDFVPGAVLTAAQVQDYLQDQSVMVFASAAARTSALASPTEGMISYLSDSNIVQMYTGSSWLTIADDGGLPVANGGTGGTTVAAAQDSLFVGLVQTVPSSVEQSGGSASVNAQGAVTFTGVNSLSLNNIFSSAYSHYRILFWTSTISAAANINMRMRASGTDKSDNTYDWVRWITEDTSAATKESAGGTNLARISYSAANDRQFCKIELANPNVAVITHAYFDTAHYGGSMGRMVGAFRQQSGQSFDGVTLFPATGTFTGTVACYGYNI